jgi:hypothetical protein
MVNKLADMTVKLFPLGCHQKLHRLGNICACKDSQDQQEHLQLNIVEEEVDKTTIRNEETAQWPGDIHSGETMGCDTVHIIGGSVSKERLWRSFITSTPRSILKLCGRCEVSEHTMHCSSPHGPCGPSVR